jgi:hypothetical protein
MWLAKLFTYPSIFGYLNSNLRSYIIIYRLRQALPLCVLHLHFGQFTNLESRYILVHESKFRDQFTHHSVLQGSLPSLHPTII